MSFKNTLCNKQNKNKTKQKQQQNWSISGQMLVLRLNDSGYRSETESEMLSNRLLCGGDKQDKNRSRCLACRTMGSLRSSADTELKPTEITGSAWRRQTRIAKIITATTKPALQSCRLILFVRKTRKSRRDKKQVLNQAWGNYDKLTYD